MARPRKLRDDESMDVAGVDKGAVRETEGEKEYNLGGRFGYIKPYLGSDRMPKGKVKEKTTKDGKRRFVVKEYNSEKRYKIIPCRNGIFKVVSIVSTGRGKLQRLETVLKTSGKKLRNRNDKSIITRLQKEGFPFSGAF